jgi:hypothetical protein
MIDTARLASWTTVALLLGGLTPLGAQMSGVPVLQNAFANPGITAGLNVGVQDGARAYGGAVSWSPGAGRIQVSAGAGAFDSKGPPMIGGGGDRAQTLTWGVRGAYSILERAGGALGVGAFLGVGGLNRSGLALISVPIGLSVGWRHALGDTRAISFYVTPFYSYTEMSLDPESLGCAPEDECTDERQRDGVLRASVGADVALTPSIGVTAGYEMGQRGDRDAGARDGVFGLGISYAFGGAR